MYRFDEHSIVLGQISHTDHIVVHGRPTLLKSKSKLSIHGGSTASIYQMSRIDSQAKETLHSYTQTSFKCIRRVSRDMFMNAVKTSVNF